MRVLGLGVALLLLAASAGAALPSVRGIVEGLGLGSGAAGLFAAAHVAGTLAGALLFSAASGRRVAALRVRRLVAGAALASAGLQLAQAASAGFGPLLALRVADGGVHVVMVMCLMGAGAIGDPATRRRQMTWLGVVLLAGIGVGLALGGRVATLAAFGPRAGLVLGALLCAVVAPIAAAALPARLAPEPRHTGGARALDVRPVVWVAAERFAAGVLTVALPFAAAAPSGARLAGRTMGLFFTTCIIAVPLGRRAAQTLGAAPVCRGAGLVLATALAAFALPRGTTATWAALIGALAGLGAGGLFAGSLVLVAELREAAARVRLMGLVHAGGGLGFVLGSTLTGLCLQLGAAGVVMGLLGGGAVSAALLVGNRKGET